MPPETTEILSQKVEVQRQALELMRDIIRLQGERITHLEYMIAKLPPLPPDELKRS